MTKSADNFRWLLSQHKLLIVAVIISLMLHVMLIIEFAIKLPLLDDETEDNMVLEARLAKPQVPERPIAERQLAPTVQKKTQQQVKKPQPKLSTPSQQPAPAAKPETLNTQDTPQAVSSTLNAATLNTTAPESETGSDHEDIGNASITNEINQTAESLQARFSHVKTQFEVRRGINTSAAGVTEILFSIHNDDSYSILSQTQAKGVAYLFFGDLVQKSEGIVTSQGLKPHFYSYQYGSDAKRLQTATFNWDEGVLSLHSNKGERTVALQQGTQDFLSFMYQFMFSPPLDHMQITMTNGKKVGTYDYSFEGEETLHTKFGELNTIHLQRSSDDDEKTEIWLATDYQYLPVRIVKTEKNGTVIEQIATSLSTQFDN